MKVTNWWRTHISYPIVVGLYKVSRKLNWKGTAPATCALSPTSGGLSAIKYLLLPHLQVQWTCNLLKWWFSEPQYQNSPASSPCPPISLSISCLLFRTQRSKLIISSLSSLIHFSYCDSTFNSLCSAQLVPARIWYHITNSTAPSIYSL